MRHRGVPPSRRDREDSDVPPVLVLRAPAEIRDGAPVGGKRGEHRGAQRVGDPPRLSPVGVHQPEVAAVVEIAVRVAGRAEGDDPPVGRPRGVRVIPLAVGELTRGAASGRHDEDVSPAIIGESLAVVSVLERRDDPRRPGLLLVLLALGRMIPADPRDEGQAAPIRAPHGIRHAMALVGQPRRLAAIGGHHVELPLLLPLALRHECQPRAVRRPSGIPIPLRPRRESPRRAAAGRIGHPDVREVLVALLGQGRRHEGHARPIGGDLRIAHPHDPRDVLRHHRTPRRGVISRRASYGR